MRHVPYDHSYTLREFVNWLLTVHIPCESVRDIWMFEGAWLAGHAIYPERFRKDQPLTTWNAQYAEWQTVMKEVAA